MQRKNKNGQSTLEYAVIIAVVVGALVAMQIYMKRGIEGKLRDSTERIGEQFEAANTSVTSTINRNAVTVQTVATNGETLVATGAQGGTNEVRSESGSENVSAW